MGSFVVLTGASGSGKTTIARDVERLGLPNCQVHFFDSIGIPSVEQMRAECGSGEAWQRAMTFRWMGLIRPILNSGTSVVFEGQMRIAFLKEALAANEMSGARVVLVDCDDATRTRRLVEDRSQAELANSKMMNWARYLRKEARAQQADILDTGRRSVTECVDLIVQWLGSSLRCS